MQEILRDRDAPAQPRGPALKAAPVVEPVLYQRSTFSWSDVAGQQDKSSLVSKCPVALGSSDSCAPCQIIRDGSCTKHAITGTNYPEAVSVVPKFRCQVHKRSFSLLQPAVYEALPRDAIIHPELVVLTEGTVFTKEAWRAMAMKVIFLTILSIKDFLFGCLEVSPHAFVVLMPAMCILITRYFK